MVKIYTYPDSTPGSKGTPDLRDRFIVGISSGENPGATGGSTTHTHGGSTSTDGNHFHATARGIKGTVWVETAEFGTTSRPGVPAEASQNFDGTYDNAGIGYDAFNTSTTGSHNHSLTTNSGSNLPPYFKLAFIMKL